MWAEAACRSDQVVEWKCVPLLLSICRGIPEGKDVSAVRQCVVGRRVCFTCIMTENYVISDGLADRMSVNHTDIIWRRFLDI